METFKEVAWVDFFREAVAVFLTGSTRTAATLRDGFTVRAECVSAIAGWGKVFGEIGSFPGITKDWVTTNSLGTLGTTLLKPDDGSATGAGCGGG